MNRDLSPGSAKSTRAVDISIIDLSGETIVEDRSTALTSPNGSRRLKHIDALDNITEVVLLRMNLGTTGSADLLSRNVYWVAPQIDALDWDNSTWYHTPVTSFSDFTALEKMEDAAIVVRGKGKSIQLENTSDVPAVFIRLNLVDAQGKDVVPVIWETNYITLWPRESYDIAVSTDSGLSVDDLRVEIEGRNVKGRTVRLNGGTQVLAEDGFR